MSVDHQRRSGDKATLSPGTRQRSAPIDRPDSAVAGATTRLIRAVGARAAQADPDAAELLLDLEAALGDAWRTAVDGWRRAGMTDGQIAEPLGVTKQAVAQRWPRASA